MNEWKKFIDIDMTIKKRNVMLYLTAESIEILKVRGVNISQMVDDYLAFKVNKSKTPKITGNTDELKEKRMELEAQLAEIKVKEADIEAERIAEEESWLDEI